MSFINPWPGDADVGRRKYTITEDDHFHARHYLDRKLHDSEWLGDIDLYLDASPVYEAARSDPQALNAWCSAPT